MEALMKCISRTSRCAILYRSKKLEPDGLNGHQHTYILNICQNPGISQERLAQMIYINKSNVARQIALLEQNGFITRIPYEKDKRVLCVFPTQKALDIYPKVKSLLQEWDSYLTEEFTQEERQSLCSFLERVMNKAILRVESDLLKEETTCEKS